MLPAPPVSVQKSKRGLPLAIANGLGWLFGGWVLAGGATYILTKSNNSEKSTLSSDAYQALLIQGYKDAAKNYLTRFSAQAFASLHDYEAKADKMIIRQNPEPSNDVIRQQDELQFLDNLLATLNQELAGFKEVS